MHQANLLTFLDCAVFDSHQQNAFGTIQSRGDAGSVNGSVGIFLAQIFVHSFCGFFAGAHRENNGRAAGGHIAAGKYTGFARRAGFRINHDDAVLAGFQASYRIQFGCGPTSLVLQEF